MGQPMLTHHARTSGTASERRSWERVCRVEFDLTPPQLAFLWAVVLYEAIHHRSVSLARIQELSDEQPPGERFDTNSSPSELYRLGLIERHGSLRERRYSPTLAGVRRVAKALGAES